jgi:hypothetical protein
MNRTIGLLRTTEQTEAQRWEVSSLEFQVFKLGKIDCKIKEKTLELDLGGTGDDQIS